MSADVERLIDTGDCAVHSLVSDLLGSGKDRSVDAMKTIRQMQRDIRALVAERDAAVQRADAAEADRERNAGIALAGLRKCHELQAALTEANARADAAWEAGRELCNAVGTVGASRDTWHAIERFRAIRRDAGETR